MKAGYRNILNPQFIPVASTYHQKLHFIHLFHGCEAPKKETTSGEKSSMRTVIRVDAVYGLFFLSEVSQFFVKNLFKIMPCPPRH